MKKKGLIISTVAMVVVLIAALTTSTYAWFSVSSKTSVEGFNINVVSDNALNIGLRRNYSESVDTTKDSSNDFVNGTCTFTGSTDGNLKTGTWTGTDYLGPTVDHQIDFGDVTKAVGFTTQTITTSTKSLNKSDSSVFANGSLTNTAFAANIDATDSSKLASVSQAVINGRTEENGNTTHGDLAYLWMGVSPTKELKEGAKLHIFVESTGGNNKLGLAAAVHVAYSVNGGDWEDEDAFGTNTYNTAKNQCSVTMPVETDEWGAKGTTKTGMADVDIELTKTAVGDLDQVQFIIYLAGDDTDCTDTSKGYNVSVNIGIYFETHEASASDDPTGISISNTGALTLTGVENSKIEYSIDNGATWTVANGSWSGTTFTSATLPATAKDKTVLVRQTTTAANKSASNAINVENNNYKTSD